MRKYSTVLALRCCSRLPPIFLLFPQLSCFLSRVPSNIGFSPLTSAPPISTNNLPLSLSLPLSRPQFLVAFISLCRSAHILSVKVNSSPDVWRSGSLELLFLAHSDAACEIVFASGGVLKFLLSRQPGLEKTNEEVALTGKRFFLFNRFQWKWLPTCAICTAGSYPVVIDRLAQNFV